MSAGRSGAALAAALAFLAAGPARADDTCKPLADAFTKFVTTPSHAYFTSKGGGSGARQGEMIRTGGALYVLVHGTWIKKPTDATEEAGELTEKLGERSATCASARGEAVEGQPTKVYTAHTSTGDTTSDSKTWLATSTGLPVRQEIKTDDGSVRSLRFDYANVAPPSEP